jgi:hypothetical protein
MDKKERKHITELEAMLEDCAFDAGWYAQLTHYDKGTDARLSQDKAIARYQKARADLSAAWLALALKYDKEVSI